MTLDEFVIQLMAGLSRAGLLFIVSAGLSLVFGALRVINLAHGSLYMLGAFVATSVVAKVGSAIGLLPAVLVAAAVVAVVGVAIEVGILRRLYRQEHLLQLLATYGVVLVVADVVRYIWGPTNRSVAAPEFLRGSIGLMGGSFPIYSLFIIAFALVIGGSLWTIVNRTSLGRDIRAAIVDPEMLAAVGVNVPRLFTIVFALGAALAGIAGAIVAPSTAVGLGMDIDIIIEAFAVTIIGGLGSITGALIGAALVGIADSFGILLAPRLAVAFIFLAMAIVLAIKPSGLFGLPDRA